VNIVTSDKGAYAMKKNNMLLLALFAVVTTTHAAGPANMGTDPALTEAAARPSLMKRASLLRKRPVRGTGDTMGRTLRPKRFVNRHRPSWMGGRHNNLATSPGFGLTTPTMRKASTTMTGIAKMPTPVAGVKRTRTASSFTAPVSKRRQKVQDRLIRIREAQQSQAAGSATATMKQAAQPNWFMRGWAKRPWGAKARARRTAAATKIQAAYRGHAARKEVAEKRQSKRWFRF
jgi:hypothetical protein